MFLARAGYVGDNWQTPGLLTRYQGNPLVRNGPEHYDYWKTGPRIVLKEGPSNYRMWYEAVGSVGTTYVAYATSKDGLTWTKKGVVMSPSGMASWEKREVSPNSILVEGGVYKLWYHAGGYPSGTNQRLGNAQIGLATSTDGLTWTKYSGNPVLQVGPAGSIDEVQVAEPRVIKIGSQYRIYYTAQNASKTKRLAMATSTAGINWIKYSGNPILPPDRWGGWGGAFIFEKGIWRLWHAEKDDVSGLRYKWSVDGITWNERSNSPVLTPSANPSDADHQAAGDSVSGYRDGNTYRIMYSGFNANFRGTGRLEAICLATIDVSRVQR